MAKSAHFQPETIPRTAVGLAYDYPGGFHIPRHHHSKAQLVYASAGVMTVTTESGSWVVPPERALWIPANITHEIHMSGDVAMRTLYLDADVEARLPAECFVVNVGPLLRELILRTVALEQPYALGGPEERLVQVLVDELSTIRVAPLHLPLPEDRRLAPIVAALQTDPADTRTLEAWTRETGASARTLARLFERETGMTFGRWRQQLRLLRALEELAAGESVTSVALSLGYDSPSAFISMFRRSLGCTPGRYFRPGASV